jgi:chromosome partitioning protein
MQLPHNQESCIMILTIGNTKGGVGKTTLAVSIAIALSIEGRKVWLIDGDRQGSSKIAMSIRANSGRLPFIQCDQIPDWKILNKQVTQKAHQFDHVVIDVGGRDSAALRVALGLSALVLVPFGPRTLDMWAMNDIQSLVIEARTANPALRAAAILSCADSTGTDNKDAVEALAGFPALEYIDAPIMRRKSVANAIGQGLCVLESMPKDKKAIQELKHLVSSILNA